MPSSTRMPNVGKQFGKEVHEPDPPTKGERFVVPPDPKFIDSERKGVKERTEPQNMIEQGEMFS